MADLTTKYAIPKLNEKNYAIWAMMIENSAHSMMAHDLLSKSCEKPDAIVDEKADEALTNKYKRFYTLKTLLLTSISENCLYIIRLKSETPYDIWTTLREHFVPTTNRNVIRLRGNFYQTKLRSFASMAKYIDSINEQAATINRLLEEIHARGGLSKGPPTISDMEKLTVLLIGLGEDFETTRDILEADSKMDYETACIRLKEKAEYGTQSNSSSSSSSSGGNGRLETVNSAETSKKKSKRCAHCNGYHRSEKCWVKFPHLKPNFSSNGGQSSNGNSASSTPQGQQPGSSSQNNVNRARPCNAPQPIQPSLPGRGRGRGRGNGNAGNANFIEEDDGESWTLEETFGPDIEALQLSTENDFIQLVIDSGASSHILGAEFHPYLTNWREGQMRTIRVADSRICESKYIADLPFKVNTSSGPRKIILRDAIYMENFPRGLVSVSKLAEKGVQTSFHSKGCTISWADVSIDIPKHPRNNLYFLNTSLPRIEIGNLSENQPSMDVEIPSVHDVAVNQDEMTQTQRKLFDLHSSLGHCSLRMLRSAVANGHITGVTLSDLTRTLENCEVCKTAKLRAHTTKDTSAQLPATQPFERVHGDYGGKYKSTWNGKCGFSVYIDELTYWITGKLLERKNGVCDHFREFSNEVKTMGFMIQELRTDSAKEVFDNRSFTDWLLENGIRQTASSPYAQYQNGFAEVTMQQIQNHIRCALYQSGLPHAYWGEAFLYAVFTWNRTPKMTSGGITPHEMVTGKIPDVKFMHPFGCQASAKHHNDDLPKFAPRGRPCVFIGYDLRRKAYQLLTLDDLTMITRAPRDVTFDDHIFPIKEHKMNVNMRSLFNDVEKDPESKSRDDYVDFYVPNPTPLNRGGDSQAIQTPVTPPITLMNGNVPVTPMQTPTLVLPPASMSSVQATPVINLDDLHFEGESSQNSQQNASHTPSPVTPDFNRQPLELQRVWGTTPTFFRHIPINLPRLRSNTQAKFSEEFFEEMMLTETEVHSHYDFDALISEINATDIVTPKSYQQAISLPEAEKWMEAMQKEMSAIIEAKTYELIPASSAQPGTKVATPIWSFRVKFDGTFKARLCFPGHRQQYGVDYFDTESPVAKFATFRMLMVIVTNLGEKIFHFDIPNAFLNGEIHETVYMKQPPGFADERFPNHVCILRRALYGLKQASLAWYLRLDDVLTSIGLKKHFAEPCLYYLIDGDEWAFVLIYVDDNAIAGTPKLRDKIINVLKKEFRAKDLGIASRYIGISIDYSSDGILLHQSTDIETFLKKQKCFNVTMLKTPFNEYTHEEIAKSDPIDETLFRSAIGSLMWYALSTRPDILFVVTTLAQFQAKPTKKAMDCVTRIYRYLKGTLKLGIFIPFPKDPRCTRFVLTPYSDASFAVPILASRSASGMIFMLNGVPVHWISRKQRLVALSSTESEIIAASLCAQELLWLLQILRPIITIVPPVELKIDNLSMKYIAESKLMSHRTKHLEIRYLFIKELLADHPVVLKWVPSEENVADILTKYFTTVGTFKTLVSMIASNRIH